MKELINEQAFTGETNGTPQATIELFRIELNGGTAALEFQKSDDTWAEKVAFTADAIDKLTLHSGQVWRFALSGGAKAYISDYRTP